MKYHGTPLSGSGCDAAKILRGRQALVSYAHPKQLEIVLAVCESFVLDNGAFTQWKRGVAVDWAGYYDWVRSLKNHPRLDWAIIPDVIDGTESDNDELLAQWPHDLRHIGVPVWHMHESVDRLVSLAERYVPALRIGSSGEFATVGSGHGISGCLQRWTRCVTNMGSRSPSCMGCGCLIRGLWSGTRWPVLTAQTWGATLGWTRLGLDVMRLQIWR